MGFKGQSNNNGQSDQYWKNQEFTQDGLDCFFNLEHLSDESDHEMDDEGQTNYREYIQFKQFLKIKENATFEDFKKYKQQQQESEMKEEIGEFLASDSDENDVDMDLDMDTEKETEKNKRNVVLTQKYIPPHLRKMQLVLNADNNKMDQLKRNFGAHLNRLLTTNLIIVTNLFQTYFDNEQYDKTEITNTLCQSIYIIINKEQEHWH